MQTLKIRLFKDKEGKFIAVEVIMNFKKTPVVNIYALNGAKIFFLNGMQQLDSVTYEQMILAGDFNGIVENKIERTLKRMTRRVNCQKYSLN